MQAIKLRVLRAVCFVPGCPRSVPQLNAVCGQAEPRGGMSNQPRVQPAQQKMTGYINDAAPALTPESCAAPLAYLWDDIM